MTETQTAAEINAQTEKSLEARTAESAKPAPKRAPAKKAASPRQGTDHLALIRTE